LAEDYKKALLNIWFHVMVKKVVRINIKEGGMGGQLIVFRLKKLPNRHVESFQREVINRQEPRG